MTKTTGPLQRLARLGLATPLLLSAPTVVVAAVPVSPVLSADTVVTMSALFSGQRTLGGHFTDVLDVKDFGAVGNGSHDDTTAVQAAINFALTKGLGYRVFIPAGTYILSAPLVATLPGNSGLIISGDGRGSTMLEWEDPSTATDWNGFEVRVGDGGVNSPYRQANVDNLQGQFVEIRDLALMQNDAVGEPAGDAIQITGDQVTTGSVLPAVTISHIHMVGGGQEGVNVPGINSGYDGWINGIHLKSVTSGVIEHIGIEGPLQSTCSSTVAQTGWTYVAPSTVGSQTVNPHSVCMVAGAGVFIDASSDYGNLSGGISVSDMNAKGYVAGEAVGGSAQGLSLSNSNLFNDEYGLMLGGGQVLDQDGGPSIVTTASGTQGQSTITAANTTGIVVGMKLIGNYLPLGTVTAISGKTITYSGSTTNAVSFTANPVTFTSGSVLTTPYGSGGFGFTNNGCDVWLSCVSAPADPSSYWGYTNVTANGNNIISNDSSLTFIAFVLGRSMNDQIDDNELISGGGGTQKFVLDTQSQFSPAPSINVEGNMISTNGSTNQIDLIGVNSGAVSGNQIAGAASVIGEDTISGNVWGRNVVNGIGVTGLPGVGNGPVVDSFGCSVANATIDGGNKRLVTCPFYGSAVATTSGTPVSEQLTPTGAVTPAVGLSSPGRILSPSVGSTTNFNNIQNGTLTISMTCLQASGASESETMSESFANYAASTGVTQTITSGGAITGFSATISRDSGSGSTGAPVVTISNSAASVITCSGTAIVQHND